MVVIENGVGLNLKERMEILETGKIVQVPRTMYVYDSEGELRAVVIYSDVPLLHSNQFLSVDKNSSS